jgi:hypothetical protein
MASTQMTPSSSALANQVVEFETYSKQLRDDYVKASVTATSNYKNLMKKKNLKTLKPKSFSMANKESSSDIAHLNNSIKGKENRKDAYSHPYVYADRLIPGSQT